jgi:hypothetical protein
MKTFSTLSRSKWNLVHSIFLKQSKNQLTKYNRFHFFFPFGPFILIISCHIFMSLVKEGKLQPKDRVPINRMAKVVCRPAATFPLSSYGHPKTVFGSLIYPYV